jgi:hypothetical protein
VDPKGGNRHFKNGNQLTAVETLTRVRNAGSVARMSNTLDADEQQQIRTLGGLGW